MNKKKVVLPADLEPDRVNALVRIGSQYDGGYVVSAALLENTHAMLSFGLGNNWEFESQWLEMTRIAHIDCYDHTISETSFARAVLRNFRLPNRRRKHWRRYRRYRAFFRHNPRVRHIQLPVGRGEGRVTLAQSLASLPDKSNAIFLKCDIEGAEYEIADDIMSAAGRFCGLVLEFHDLHTRWADFLRFTKAMRKTHFLDHVHVNNYSEYDASGTPSVVELSLSRKDEKPGSPLLHLHGLQQANNGTMLDAPNARSRPDVWIQYA